MFAGVCGGLGEYFNVDPTLVRLVFVVAAFFGGLGLLAYLVLMILMPEEDAVVAGSPAIDVPSAERGRELLGLLLVVGGLLWLLSNVGVFRFVEWRFVWPLLVIAAGVLLIARRR